MSEDLEQATGDETAETGGGETLLTAETPKNEGQGGQTAKEDESDTAASSSKGEVANEKSGKAGGSEPYELTAPEGYPMDAGALKAFTEHCRAAGFSKEQAEAQLAWMQGNYQRWQEQQAAQRKSWREELRADKEFGGDKYGISVTEAQQGLAEFDKDDKIKTMLRETGYGDHPDVIRIFARVGRALAEDRIHGQGGGQSMKPLEDRMYPDM